MLLVKALNKYWKVKLSLERSDLRSKLWVIDQILQRVATAEFIQQPGQVADYSRWVRGVDVAWNAPNLYQRHVPIGIGPICCADLQRETSQQITLLSHQSISNTMKPPIDQITHVRVFFTTRLLLHASSVLRLMLNRTAVGKVLLLMKPRHWASLWWPFKAKSTLV